MGNAPDHAVIGDKTVFTAQYAIAALAHAQLGPGIDVHAVHELCRIGADHLDLAQGRGIENAAVLAHRQTFAPNRRLHILAPLREEAGAFPQGHVFENGPLLDRPIMDRGRADRIEQVAPRHARQHPEGHRRVGHTEGGQANLRDRPVQGVRDHAQRIKVRGLALIGRHAGRGVALNMLDGLEALAHGQLQILGGDVVLPVDKGLGPLAAIVRQGPDHALGIALNRFDGKGLRHSMTGRISPSRKAIGQSLSQPKLAPAGTCRPFRLGRLTWQIGL